MCETDVLVAGLGPAGACAAAAAARAGVRVIAVDRKAAPGQPVQCAELVPGLVAGSRIVSRVRRQEVSIMTTRVEDMPPYVSRGFPGQMIDRAAFDAVLVGEATRAGAEIRLATPIRGLHVGTTEKTGRGPMRGAVVLADGSIVRARVVIGADGPRSVIGRAIGRVNAALAETRQISVPLRQASASTDIFLSAGMPGGYAWLFPKGDVANLGLGLEPAARHRLRPLLENLHRRLAAEGRVGRAVLRRTGGAIPVGGMLDPVGRLGATWVLLAGDAAGLANPVTGAGINAAVLSGTLAGEAAARACAGAEDAASTYAEELDDVLGGSLGRALERRRALLQTYAEGGPGPADLERAWIAFPAYWAA